MMKTTTEFSRALTVLALTLLSIACSPVEDPGIHPLFSANTALPVPSKPSTVLNPQGNLYWGDLHIHTSYSTDAYTMGVRALPDDAYTFTRGGEIEHAGGYGIRLKRPLDFAAVTDHSEYLGVLRAQAPDLPLSQRSFSDRLRNDGRLRNTIAFFRSTLSFDLKNVDASGAQQATRSAWQDTIAAAQRHNRPGEFTTFVAYEWSSFPDSDNLHRNVVYRDSTVPEVPFSSLESEDPRDLWSALEQQRKKGMDNFAIPHNGNVSNGRMYGNSTYSGAPMTAEYVRRRMENEPISEIFQVKGSSETHPELSPQDEFAGFEIYDTKLSKDFASSEPKGSYARDALRLGLEMSHSEGFNPYRFGVIGSSDGHNASSPVEEDNYHGKLPLLDGSAATRMRTNSFLPEEMPGGRPWSAAGLAAVWAKENTRDSLFEAMRRKETFASSGPRIVVRFFGGWDYTPELLEHDDWIALAQESGVAMGGVLPGLGASVRASAAPRFALWAIRDPDSGNLDRIQVVKGWLDAEGKSRERIFDVVWSGQRKHGADGQLSAVGNTVNVADASYENSIGAPQLSAVWADPEFDVNAEAFYYARVIEIPTPRWSTYDAKTLGIEAPEPTSLQERAVTSAIWYQPGD